MLDPSPTRRWAPIGAALLVAVRLTAAPAAEPPAAPTAEQPDEPPPAESPAPSPAQALAHEPCAQTDAACALAVEHARADLAARLQIEPELIELIRRDRVTWRNGSLGCPKPGRLYTMALVEGLFIELRVDARSYRYHGGGRDPFLCEPPSLDADGGSQD